MRTTIVARTRWLPLAMTLLIAALAAPLVTGCAQSATDYSARFIRYSKTAEGQRIAIVTPLAEETEEQTAYTSIADLEPGEVVRVRAAGKDWDQPANAPQREIVSRSEGDK